MLFATNPYLICHPRTFLELGLGINSIPSRNEDLIKAKGGATITDFIGSMHTGMLLCFHWNVFKYTVVLLLESI